MSVVQVTHWQGSTPFCAACSHYHNGPCLCPECGRPVKQPGTTHSRCSA